MSKDNKLLFEKLTRWATNKPKILKEDEDPCWEDHKMVGTKDKGGKKVPNCVPKESLDEDAACGCEACKDNEDEMILGQELEETPNP